MIPGNIINTVFPLRNHFTLLEHLSSSQIFSGVRVTRSLVLCVCFVDRFLYFFYWPLCCLFVFDSDYLPLLSSNSSYSYVCFVDRCLSFCTFSIGHCVVCSIYGFWLPPFIIFKLFLYMFVVRHYFCSFYSTFFKFSFSEFHFVNLHSSVL